MVEIFVFLEMGGKHEDLEVRLLGSTYGDCQPGGTPPPLRGGTKSRISQSLHIALENFDARNACAFKDYDTQRLQQVIASTGYDRITELVKTVFVTKL